MSYSFLNIGISGLSMIFVDLGILGLSMIFLDLGISITVGLGIWVS